MTDREKQLRLRDDDGGWVTSGDSVQFSYGIPPVTVIAPIIERDGKLIGLCPGHDPADNLRPICRECNQKRSHFWHGDELAEKEAAMLKQIKNLLHGAAE